jgi:hypothetical protein
MQSQGGVLKQETASLGLLWNPLLLVMVVVPLLLLLPVSLMSAAAVAGGHSVASSAVRRRCPKHLPRSGHRLEVGSSLKGGLSQRQRQLQGGLAG